MKRLWLGLGLVALILVAGVFLEQCLEGRHHPQAEALEQAADWARQENWQMARELLTRTRQDWQEHRDLVAALVHHGILDDIDVCFAKLEVYAAEGSRTEFCAGCAGLALQLRNLPKSHGFDWWNSL